MGYTPPGGNTLSFLFDTGYTAPDGGRLAFRVGLTSLLPAGQVAASLPYAFSTVGIAPVIGAFHPLAGIGFTATASGIAMVSGELSTEVPMMLEAVGLGPALATVAFRLDYAVVTRSTTLTYGPGAATIPVDVAAVGGTQVFGTAEAGLPIIVDVAGRGAPAGDVGFNLPWIVDGLAGVFHMGAFSAQVGILCDAGGAHGISGDFISNWSPRIGAIGAAARVAAAVVLVPFTPSRETSGTAALDFPIRVAGAGRTRVVGQATARLALQVAATDYGAAGATARLPLRFTALALGHVGASGYAQVAFTCQPTGEGSVARTGAAALGFGYLVSGMAGRGSSMTAGVTVTPLVVAAGATLSRVVGEGVFRLRFGVAGRGGSPPDPVYDSAYASVKPCKLYVTTHQSRIDLLT